MDRPLVILNFQGVLGDFVREKTVQEKGAPQEPQYVLNLRQGALDGIKLLTNHF